MVLDTAAYFFFKDRDVGRLISTMLKKITAYTKDLSQGILSYFGRVENYF